MTDDLREWRTAAYKHARERDKARAELDRYAALLAEASEALCAVGKAAITVEPTLKQPYPDAPNTSPWERFMERPARRAYNLGHQIRRELNQASTESSAPSH